MKTNSLALGWQRLERLVVLVDVQVFAQVCVQSITIPHAEPSLNYTTGVCLVCSLAMPPLK
jgi:hypothetical protein